MKSNLVDLKLDYRHETDNAFAVWNGNRRGDGTEKWIWISKKYVERAANIGEYDGTLICEKCLTDGLRALKVSAQSA